MNKSALIESLMSTFLEEVEEHVSGFNRDLLALEGEEVGVEAADVVRHLLHERRHQALDERGLVHRQAPPLRLTASFPSAAAPHR